MQDKQEPEKLGGGEADREEERAFHAEQKTAGAATHAHSGDISKCK